MRVTSSLIFISIALVISACSGDIGVSDVQFGSFSGVGTSFITFQAAGSLSRKQEPHFGWAFSMKNPPKELTVREVIEGPAGAMWESPNNSPEVQVTDGGKTARVTKTISKPASPLLFHNWSISNSDPIGKYRASLYIDGKLIRQVEFNVTN